MLRSCYVANLGTTLSAKVGSAAHAALNGIFGKGDMVLPPPLGTGLLTAALFYAVILRAPPNTGTVRASNALLSLFFGVAAG